MNPKLTPVIWDLPVRVFHWGTVLLLIGLYVTAQVGGDAMNYHKLMGYGILWLILFRVIWGVVGSEHARFAKFCCGPQKTWQYARTLFHKKTSHYSGHNPVGALSVILMLLLLGIQAATGLFSNDDVLLEGPLAFRVNKETSDFLTTIHKQSFNFLFALIIFHVAAVVFYLLHKKNNLITAMFTGRKPNQADNYSSSIQPLWKAIASGICAAAMVYFIVTN